MGQQFNLERRFDATFTAMLAQREKQIQQNYRPIIGVHKWFARRPGTVFRNLLLAEFNGDEPLRDVYWQAHEMKGVIADPFMGGGTPIYEANRLGFSIVGTDINPMAFWIVRQSLARLDLDVFCATAERVAADVEKEIGELYTTTCVSCGKPAPVKYFIWVKVATCPVCAADNDLFPGYLLAEATRHPRHVVACTQCGHLNEYDQQPTLDHPAPCGQCGEEVHVQGIAKNNKVICNHCGSSYRYPSLKPDAPPRHRMWAIEYQCASCKSQHEGRFFKKPDEMDLQKVGQASARFEKEAASLPIPDDKIPDGDETRRLHRWGYSRFCEMFNERQLLGLGLLLKRIMTVEHEDVRHALLTVFSDFLRYQNMLCRYDTYALKCQDIFSVHGFPVGLVQCENNLLGIPKVGSGAFRHFVQKYLRAKQYCLNPFETWCDGNKKKVIPIDGERIEVKFTQSFPLAPQRQACIKAAPATQMTLPPDSLDGVFTDPPYFDNVQYAELMDFCFAWLRLGLKDEIKAFLATSTKDQAELTGNDTMGRGLDHFTQGLSDVFCHCAAALKSGAPFVFTYHHNEPTAYVPLVVAILDARMDCTATLPVPAEMGASLHIARSNSSVLDSVFVCRKAAGIRESIPIEQQLQKDVEALVAAGLKISDGDMRCLLAGHIARLAINRLRASWPADASLVERMRLAEEQILKIRDDVQVARLVARFAPSSNRPRRSGDIHAAAL